MIINISTLKHFLESFEKIFDDLTNLILSCKTLNFRLNQHLTKKSNQTICQDTEKNLR